MYRVGKKNDPLWFFANISAKGKNFQTKFYRLIDNSFLHIDTKFHQTISNRPKVIFRAFGESTPLILTVQKHITQYNVAKHYFSSQISNNHYKTNLLVSHNMCLIFLSQVCPTHVRSIFFANLLIGLVDGFLR